MSDEGHNHQEDVEEGILFDFLLAANEVVVNDHLDEGHLLNVVAVLLHHLLEELCRVKLLAESLWELLYGVGHSFRDNDSSEISVVLVNKLLEMLLQEGRPKVNVEVLNWYVKGFSFVLQFLVVFNCVLRKEVVWVVLGDFPKRFKVKAVI